MIWIQRNLRLPAKTRGFHQITREVLEAIPEVDTLSVGVLHVFLRHTSASLTLNENADPDVMHDLESSFSAIAPESFPYSHTCEGPDDMPAHVKSSMIGAAITAPVGNGKLLLGTWQGITLCEHRNHASAREIVLTLWGQA